MVDYTAKSPSDGSLGPGAYIASALVVAVLLFALFGSGAGTVETATSIAPDAIAGSAAGTFGSK